MASKWHGLTCPECGKGTLHDGAKLQVVDYRGESFSSQRVGAFCDNCGDGLVVHDPDEEARWKDFRDRVDAQQAKELAAIRARLNLTQEQASTISGGGHNAFSRYERLEAQPVMGVINLFRLLDNYPEMLVHFLHDRTTTLVTTSTSTARIGDENLGTIVARVGALSAPLPFLMFDTRLAISHEIDEALPIVPTMARVPRQPAPQVRTLKIPQAQRKGA